MNRRGNLRLVADKGEILNPVKPSPAEAACQAYWEHMWWRFSKEDQQRQLVRMERAVDAWMEEL